MRSVDFQRRAADARMRERAFTLVELLAVIAIIAVLAALLFPAIRSAYDRGRSAVCLSNFKQIGGGLALFGADTGGSTPVEYSQNGTFWWYWADLIQPYIDPAKARAMGGAGDSALERGVRSTVFDCPANKTDRFDQKYNIRIGSYGPAGLSANGVFTTLESTLDGIPFVFGVKLDSVRQGVNRSPPPPAGFVLVMDGFNPEYPTMPNFNYSLIRTRTKGPHEGGARMNAVYADGHAVGIASNTWASYTNGLPYDLPN